MNSDEDKDLHQKESREVEESSQRLCSSTSAAFHLSDLVHHEQPSQSGQTLIGEFLLK